MVLGVRCSTEQSVGGASSFGRTGSSRAHDGDVAVDQARFDDIDDIGRKLADTCACVFRQSACVHPWPLVWIVYDEPLTTKFLDNFPPRRDTVQAI